MTGAPDLPILIAGAGIAGLACAVTLARSGFSVALIERATRFEEVGAGLQLSPNASRVLIDLGLGPALARQATTPDALAVHRFRSPRVVARMPMNAMQSEFGAPFWNSLRADLQRALIDAARADRRIAFMVGRAVEGFTERSHSVTVRVATASGASETIEGCALIGADGLWSRVRSLIGETAPARFIGYEAWRARLPADQAPAELRDSSTHLWMGRDAHVVHYPVAGGQLINVVAVRSAAAPREDTARGGWNAGGDASELSDVATAIASPARELLAAAPSWGIWSLYDRAPLTRWVRGRIALVGDAAHPVPPFLAQGAALAIEDAAVIAQEAARAPDDLPAAFARYAARRRARAARVQRESRANGRAYHAGGLFALARDLMLARLGQTGMARRYRWLYGWTPDT